MACPSTPQCTARASAGGPGGRILLLGRPESARLRHSAHCARSVCAEHRTLSYTTGKMLGCPHIQEPYLHEYSEESTAAGTQCLGINCPQSLCLRREKVTQEKGRRCGNTHCPTKRRTFFLPPPYDPPLRSL